MIAQRRLRPIMTAFFLIALMLLLVAQAVAVLRAEVLFSSVETELSFWGRSDYQPSGALRKRTGQRVSQLASTWPQNANYLTLHANQLAWEGYWGGKTEEASQHWKRAAQAQRKALQYRPAHRQDWVKLLQYAAALDAGTALQFEASARLEALQAGTKRI